MTCSHFDVSCLNDFDLIRKYRCLACEAVMMCSCNEAVGIRFLPHQLANAVASETHQPVKVTAGFQPSICRECRGLPPDPHPVAAIHGRTSKIKRYYWREIALRGYELFGEWLDASGIQFSRASVNPMVTEAHKSAIARALDEIKALHASSPKYIFSEESQAKIISRYSVDVLDMHAMYARTLIEGKALVLDQGQAVSVEEFVSRHFRRQGYSVLQLESRPFHVLFGVFMWLLIQDPTDPHLRIVGFGDRTAVDAGQPGRTIWTHLPDDFGTAAYATRRAAAIKEHLSPQMKDREELEWLFEYWLDSSEDVRQYLWAHRSADFSTARQLISILPAPVICEVLLYLVQNYWDRYLGWPDLLVYRDDSFLLAEVKSSKDRLTDNQKRWIKDNYEILHLPFKLVKVHRAAIATNSD